MHLSGHMVVYAQSAFPRNLSCRDMRRMRMAYIGVILLLLGATVARAADLSGVVTDRVGAIVVGATVHVQSGSFSAEQRTDASGHFFFRSLPGGDEASVTVRAPS